MKGQLYNAVLLALLLLIVLTQPASGSGRWQNPFPTNHAEAGATDSIMTLQTVLQLVAAQNPLLPSLALQSKAAEGGIIQAGVRPNPELAAEIEEVGWDAPGFNESEITVSLSQEFELFGQRGARRRVAEASWQVAEFEAGVAAFDLYLDTRGRYYSLAHAQEQYHLSNVSIGLAEDIVATIQQRIDKGVGLESELLLARLELQRAKLFGTDAKSDIETAQIELTSMWASDFIEVRVAVSAEPDIEAVFGRISKSTADSTRELQALDNQRNRLLAQRHLSKTEVRPNLTLSGGYKRLAANESNSLIFGLALPLPFRDQNRGTLQILDAKIQQIDFDRRQARLKSMAAVVSGVATLRQLSRHLDALDDVLLPTAEEAYRTIETLHQSGRLPYTSLLEARRSLVELRFEHNDILFAIYEQIIAMERLGGVILQADED